MKKREYKAGELVFILDDNRICKSGTMINDCVAIDVLWKHVNSYDGSGEGDSPKVRVYSHERNEERYWFRGKDTKNLYTIRRESEVRHLKAYQKWLSEQE